jgi:hypothetical protein
MFSIPEVKEWRDDEEDKGLTESVVFVDSNSNDSNQSVSVDQSYHAPDLNSLDFDRLSATTNL